MSGFVEIPTQVWPLLHRAAMVLAALAPAVIACVLFVETLRIRSRAKH